MAERERASTIQRKGWRSRMMVKCNLTMVASLLFRNIRKKGRSRTYSLLNFCSLAWLSTQIFVEFPPKMPLLRSALALRQRRYAFRSIIQRSLEDVCFVSLLIVHLNGIPAAFSDYIGRPTSATKVGSHLFLTDTSTFPVSQVDSPSMLQSKYTF